MGNKVLIEFNEVEFNDPVTKKKRDAVEVFRNGNRVATINEYSRLKRALNLSLEEVNHILKNFADIMNRQPTRDETEFWKAIRDVKKADQ